MSSHKKKLVLIVLLCSHIQEAGDLHKNNLFWLCCYIPSSRKLSNHKKCLVLIVLFSSLHQEASDFHPPPHHFAIALPGNVATARWLPRYQVRVICAYFIFTSWCYSRCNMGKINGRLFVMVVRCSPLVHWGVGSNPVCLNFFSEWF